MLRWTVAFALLLGGCGGDDRRGSGDGGADTGPSMLDAGVDGRMPPPDDAGGGERDAGAVDAGSADAAGADAGPGDAGITCVGTSIACDGACVDPATDRSHCGSCGTACGVDELCVGGGCATDCSVGTVTRIVCGSVCTLPDADPDNCGGCGVVCPDGQACIDSLCTTTCPGGATVCDRFCRDTLASIGHCGGCGMRCTAPIAASPSCSGGVCGWSCRADRGNCDGDDTNGCETDTTSDEGHCGGCGMACPASQFCVGSACLDPKRVFVTDTRVRGDLGGLAGADAVCAADATAAALGGTWRAWISDARGNAAGRLAHATVPYVLVNGTVIAVNWTGLVSGTLSAPINRDPYGTLISASTVFTGTRPDGTQGSVSADCNQWSTASSSESARIGRTNMTNAEWTSVFLPASCSTSRRLYCFEQ